MKKQHTFYAKVFILYILIFISFLVKTYTSTNFYNWTIAVKASDQFMMIEDLFHYPTTPHQAR
ncbi:MAG TPA: hypothetical protein VK796_06150 [Cytophaga sp.]|jgi:hypothetical protein|nr:hypothetical protein [Cytophaga sp.]